METGLWETHPNTLSNPSPPSNSQETERNMEQGSKEKKDQTGGDEDTKTVKEKEREKQKWQEKRYEGLLKTMLNLDQPKITHNMTDMLSKPEVCRKMVEFLTLINPNQSNEDDNKEESVKDETAKAGKVDVYEREVIRGKDERMRLSYQVMCVLTGMANELTASENAAPVIDRDVLELLLGKVSDLVVPQLFDAFQPQSQASLHHICPVFTTLLAFQGETVYTTLNKSNHFLQSQMQHMLNYVHIHDVSTLLIALVCPSTAKPVVSPQIQPGFGNYGGAKPQTYTNNTLWSYYNNLAKWKFMAIIAQHIKNKDAPAEHRIAAAEFFSTIVNKLASDPSGGGAILLQPLGHCPEILETLVSVSCSADEEMKICLAALECLVTVYQLSMKEEIAAEPNPNQPYAGFANGGAVKIANQLNSVKEHMQDIIENHFTAICTTLVHTAHGPQRKKGGFVETEPEPVKHAAYTVKVPFTYYRLLLVKLLRSCLCAKPENFLENVPKDLSKLLCSWLLQYPHSSLYHNEFIEIFHTALKYKDSDNGLVRNILQKNKLITVLVEYYQDKEKKGDVKGHIIRILNMVRLMASSLSPTHHFLPQFLKSHDTWRSFRTTLEEDTLVLVQPWDENTANSLRIAREAKASGMMHAGGYVSDVNPFTANMNVDSDMHEEGIDLGSRFADELGFGGYVTFSSAERDQPETGSSGKKKKRKNKKKKSATTKELVNENDDSLD